MSVFAKIAGTILQFFEFQGPTGAGIQNNAGALETRNAANSAFAIHRGADPVGAHDFVTLGSLTSLAGIVNTIRIPIALVTVSSASSIPANAIVLRAFLETDTAYSGGTTITLGTAANAMLFMAAADSAPTAAIVGGSNLFDAPQDTAVAVANPLLVTIAGAPAAGAGFACVMYVEPLT